MNKKVVLMILALGSLLVGCSKPYDGAVENGVNYGDTTTYGSYDMQQNSGDTYGNYGNYGTNGSYGNAGAYSDYGNYYDDPNYGVNVVAGPKATEKDRVVYFAFDSSRVDDRSKAVIAQHAQYLKTHPNIMVVLEGHTDERGTRDYNIALGERRAYAVKQVFQALGVNGAQMRVLSYGEERPAVWGSTEAAYARNRRVVIVY